MEKITQNYVVLSGAYGLDYGNKRTIIADFEAGKAFIIRSVGVNEAGKLCNIRDFAKGVTVELRYAADKQVVLYKVKQ